MTKKNCENCNWCEKEGEDLICVNSESEYAADYVEENHVCDDWEGNN